MSPNNRISIGKMLKDDVTKWLRIVEYYFEKNTAAHIIVKLFVIVFAILAALDDFLGIADRFWSPVFTSVSLLIIVIVLAIVDFQHVMIARRRAHELKRTRSLVDNMANIIREASGLNSPPYQIEDWFSEHDISPTGDVKFKKVMTISYISETIYWIRVPIGVIDGEMEDKIDDLAIDVRSAKDGGQLPYVSIEESYRKKTLAIMLEPPVTLNQNSSVRLRLTWRGAYTPLISRYQDHGKITVQHDAKKVTIKLIAPLGLEFTAIRMIHGIGSSTIALRDDGRCVLTWECSDVKKGEYTYTLVAKRREP